MAGLDPKQVEQTVERHRGEPAYRPIVIVEDASLAQVAAVRARRLESELPDVVVEEVPTRRYPADALAAHLFGYVGEANDTQVAGGAAQGAIIGQQGLEKAYNDLLMGQDGASVVVVNSLGREIRTLEEVPPGRGPPAAADDRRRPAAGRRGRLPARRVQRRGAGASTRATARC